MRDYSEVITKEEAIAAVTAASWAQQVESCGHTGCRDHLVDGERYIHSFLGGFGADHSLTTAIAEIMAAERVCWSRPHLLDHELTVLTSEGKILRYDARQPVSADA